MLRLYIALGIVAALALGGLALYAKGRIDQRHAVELQTLKTQIKVLEDERAREEAARKADAAQAKTDREEADLAELHAQELEDALTDRDRQCFDAGDADGLRDHINGKD
jgi:hypothetical protein